MFFIWVDLETTGLDPQTREILSVGCRVTNTNLNTLGEIEVDVSWNGDRYDDMDTAAREMHERSGLLNRCAKSLFSLREALTLVRHLILTKAPGKPADRVLAGSSVHFDARFLREADPSLFSLWHYRMLDVSVFRVLADAGWVDPWKGDGEPKHTPLADLDASIAALRFYREHFFLPDPGALVQGKTREQWEAEFEREP